MSKLKNNLVTDFCNRYAEKQGVQVPEKLMEMLANEALLNTANMRNYLILADYGDFLGSNGGHVLDTVYQLADKYQLSERQIQNIIYDRRRKTLAHRVG